MESLILCRGVEKFLGEWYEEWDKILCTSEEIQVFLIG